jgi:hypothetical protein
MALEDVPATAARFEDAATVLGAGSRLLAYSDGTWPGGADLGPGSSRTPDRRLGVVGSLGGRVGDGTQIVQFGVWTGHQMNAAAGAGACAGWRARRPARLAASAGS